MEITISDGDNTNDTCSCQLYSNPSRGGSDWIM